MLENQVVIVTGAGEGIGKSIALRFAKEGAKLVVSDYNEESAKKAAAEIIQAGGNAIAIACDVTDPTQREELVKKCREAFGEISILVNNAGGGGPQPFTMDLSTFQRAFDLNVFSIFHLSQLCVPSMEKIGGGVILNISSMAAENINVNMSSYASSKAATSHLTRNLAYDLGSKNIRVNAIAPGAIKTNALKKVLTPEVEKAMLKKTPLGRLGEVEDISNAALFLCSDSASWISGQILTVSGGGTQEIN